MGPEIARTPRTLLAAACLFVAAHAAAQEPEPAWRVALGAGLDWVPKFPGSDSHKILPLPFIAASYGRFFFGAFPGAASIAGVGVNLYQDRHWRFGVAVSAGLAERRESDDPRLQGLGDVRRTASAGVALAYTESWYVLGASVLSDILNRGQGTLVSLNALARHRASDRLTFFGGPGLTWADGRYTQTFFGVSADQSAASGLPEFGTHPGFNSARLGLGAGYRITERWSALGFASLSTLLGDAVNSPITESRSQYFLGMAIFYRFGNAPALGDPGGFVFGQ
jgi:outer membrane protein